MHSLYILFVCVFLYVCLQYYVLQPQFFYESRKTTPYLGKNSSLLIHDIIQILNLKHLLVRNPSHQNPSFYPYSFIFFFISRISLFHILNSHYEYAGILKYGKFHHPKYALDMFFRLRSSSFFGNLKRFENIYILELEPKNAYFHTLHTLFIKYISLLKICFYYMFDCVYKCLFSTFSSFINCHCLFIVYVLIVFSCIYKTDNECLFLDMSLFVNIVTKLTHLTTCTDRSKQIYLINYYMVIINIGYYCFYLWSQSLNTFNYQRYANLDKYIVVNNINLFYFCALKIIKWEIPMISHIVMKTYDNILKLHVIDCKTIYWLNPNLILKLNPYIIYDINAIEKTCINMRCDNMCLSYLLTQVEKTVNKVKNQEKNSIYRSYFGIHMLQICTKSKCNINMLNLPFHKKP